MDVNWQVEIVLRIRSEHHYRETLLKCILRQQCCSCSSTLSSSASPQKRYPLLGLSHPSGLYGVGWAAQLLLEEGSVYKALCIATASVALSGFLLCLSIPAVFGAEFALYDLPPELFDGAIYGLTMLGLGTGIWCTSGRSFEEICRFVFKANYIWYGSRDVASPNELEQLFVPQLENYREWLMSFMTLVFIVGSSYLALFSGLDSSESSAFQQRLPETTAQLLKVASIIAGCGIVFWVMTLFGLRIGVTTEEYRHTIQPASLQTLLEPYEPIDGINWPQTEPHTVTTVPVRFLDPQVAARFIQDVKTGQLVLPGESTAEAASHGIKTIARSFARLWRGESRAVRWKFAPNETEREIQTKLRLEAVHGSSHIREIQSSEGEAKTFIVTFFNTEAAAKAVSFGTKMGENIQPLPFRVGSIQDAVTVLRRSLNKTKPLNSIRISKFDVKAIPDSRQASSFYDRLSNGSPLLKSLVPLTEKVQGSITSRNQWLAIELGMISRTLVIRFDRPTSSSSIPVGADELYNDFSPYGLIHRTDVHNGIGFVNFFDISSAAAATSTQAIEE
ncbi:hypothetical protein VNI00_016782 [Paramarasmius palmivorus]|uniref:Uncharacterized protein n=1 Tax=Paramarasmius palmivorus TaxID=297713 RepID=A0AAW0BCR8_9AGAR